MMPMYYGHGFYNKRVREDQRIAVNVHTCWETGKQREAADYKHTLDLIYKCHNYDKLLRII